MKKGDYVHIEREGRSITAQIIIASPNARSLIVTFDGMFFGYVQMMPLTLEPGDTCYRDLFGMREMHVTRMGVN